MRHLSWILLVAALLASCSRARQLSKVSISNPAEEPQDSVSYELVVLDPGFESWYLMHSRPDWYHSQSYYETWNLQYVPAWNSKVMMPRYSRLFEHTIDYDSFTDYGLDLNHKLFYYFQYVEHALRIPVLPQGMGPRAVF